MVEAAVCFSCSDLGVISTGKCFSASKTEHAKYERRDPNQPLGIYSEGSNMQVLRPTETS